MMRTLCTVLAGMAGVSALVLASASPVRAQSFDERVFFTFDEPVAVPGTVLPAGDYVFRLADPGGSRRVVQVLSADFSTVHSMFLTNDAIRREPPREYEVTFGEAPSGAPRPIDGLWMPGSVHGRGFVYSPGERSWNRTERAVGANATGN